MSRSLHSCGKRVLYFHEGYTNWTTARDYCRSLSNSQYTSDLATVDSCEQLGDIYQHVVMEYGLVWHWLGGSDEYEESGWHWVTGGTVPRSVPFWYPGRPTIDTSVNCLSMHSQTGYLYDHECNLNGSFICEEFPFTV
nr:C-type lectin domain family 17, member A-like [Cherax quadricarinatus]